jgi:hypothetical protein
MMPAFKISMRSAVQSNNGTTQLTTHPRSGEQRSPLTTALRRARTRSIGSRSRTIECASLPGEIDGRCGPYPTAGPRVPLDGVAQIAERKYCARSAAPAGLARVEHRTARVCLGGPYVHRNRHTGAV